ncbi:MAG: hypothetical protein K0R14_899 [Burkholderiales bacterium]|jgi:hypothetical protein|nr:hypothetical protein [Burkholderiales bacterium]
MKIKHYLQSIFLILSTGSVWALQEMECTMDSNFRYYEKNKSHVEYMEDVANLPTTDRRKIEGGKAKFINKNDILLTVVAKDQIASKNDIKKITFSDLTKTDKYPFKNVVATQVAEISLSPLTILKGTDSFSLTGSNINVPGFNRWAEYTWSLKFINDNKWEANLSYMGIPRTDHEYNPDFDGQLESFSGRYTCKPWVRCDSGVCSVS